MFVRDFDPTVEEIRDQDDLLDLIIDLGDLIEKVSRKSRLRPKILFKKKGI